MAQFLLDTNTLSAQVKSATGNRGITNKVDLYGLHRCAISSITLHELIYGQMHGKGRISKEKLARMGATYPHFELTMPDPGRVGSAELDELGRHGLRAGIAARRLTRAPDRNARSSACHQWLA